MSLLRDLLATWENWSAHDTLTRALTVATTEHDRDVLRRGLHTSPEVDPLDALRAGYQLVALLRRWQWQAVYTARRAGSSWDQIAYALDVSTEQARADYLAAVVQQECHGISDSTAYREVL